MSQEVTTAFVKKFTAGIRLLQQQMSNRLRAGVMIDDTVPGDRAFYDQLDATAMSEITNRHGDTEYIDTPHSRRMVTMKTYEVADLVDRADIRRLLNNPINGYSRSMAAAANRQFDDIIIAAFDASANTGVDGGTAVSFPSAFQRLADGSGAGDGTGTAITLVGLRNARELLEAAENEEDDGDNKWFAATNAETRNQLLGITQITDSDFNTIRALVNGQVDTYLGFTFVKSERLSVHASGARLLPFWVKKSMQLGISEESRSFMDVLPTKRHSTQVRYEMDAGATRMDEKGVVILEQT